MRAADAPFFRAHPPRLTRQTGMGGPQAKCRAGLAESSYQIGGVSLKRKVDQPTIELYKLAVEMADRVSARRGSANQYYLGLETVILGAPLMAQYLGSNTVANPELLTALGGAGVLVAFVWWMQLNSYRHLNSAKFKVIITMEERHFVDKIFLEEWLELKTGAVSKWGGRYGELGTVERFVPWLFIAAHGLIIWSAWI